MSGRGLAAVAAGVLWFLSGCGGQDSGLESGQDNSTGLPDTSIPGPVPVFNGMNRCGVTQYTVITLPQALPRAFRTVIMGSSSAAGAGASRSALSWAGQYAAWQQGNGGTTVNLARGGYTTYQGLPEYCQPDESRPQPDEAYNISRVLAERPDLVLISYPSNDAALGWSAQESVGNIRVLRSVLADAGVASVVMSAQPRNISAARTALLLEFDRLLQQQLTDCVVPLYDLLQKNNQLNPEFDAGDGVHLNDKGHALVFDALRQVLVQSNCVSLPE